jgi:hypothetical protein
MNLIKPGERAVGEWLEEAHGTRYELVHEPFVIFDLMTGTTRTKTLEVMRRVQEQGFTAPHLLHSGAPISIEHILEKLETPYHGELDPVEGAVWRLELNDSVHALAKYVRPESVAGRYFEQLTGKPTIYQWQPPHTTHTNE